MPGARRVLAALTLELAGLGHFLGAGAARGDQVPGRAADAGGRGDDDNGLRLPVNCSP